MNVKDSLREHGLKATPPRVEILSMLSLLLAPVSAEELARKLADKDIDLSTIYRNLNAFVEAGLVKKEVGRGKENIFKLNQENEYHLLVCMHCGKTIPLPGCPYHEIHEEIERKTGFRLIDHNTEIYGICPDCQRLSSR